MKILQFMASEKWGGAEKVFVDLSNGLAENHEVIALVLRQTEYLERFAENVEVLELHSHPTTHNPFLLLEILHIFRERQPDLVHTHGGKAALLVNRVNTFRRIVHLATKHNARKGRIFNYLQWVSVVSEEARKSVRSKNPLSEVRVIHNGILPENIPDAGLDATFSMAAIGRLDKIKGFDRLLAQLAHLDFDFRLKIVGEGPEHANLANLIRSYALQEKVILTGFRRDVAHIINSSHLVVISSLSEGFPQILVETLFYGNMLLSTPVGGVREVLPELFLADHEELGSKIKDVHARYDFYHTEFITLRKKTAARFHLHEILKSYEALYAEMLAKENAL